MHGVMTLSCEKIPVDNIEVKKTKVVFIVLFF